MNGRRFFLVLFAALVCLPFAVGGLDDAEAYYSHDDADTSGSTSIDRSGNGNDGTNNGATTGVTGVLNEAYSFDGSEYIEISDDSIWELSLSGSWTVAFWAKGTDTGNTVIWDKNGNSGWSIQQDGGSNYMVMNLGGTGDGAIQTQTTINDGAWHHVVFTMDSGTGKVYIDGQDKTTSQAGTHTPSYGSESVYIGSRSGNYGWVGELDEAGFWSRALSSSEVSDLYNSGQANNPYAGSSHDVTINDLSLSPSPAFDSDDLSTSITINDTTDAEVSWEILKNGAAFSSGTDSTFSSGQTALGSVSNTNTEQQDTFNISVEVRNASDNTQVWATDSTLLTISNNVPTITSQSLEPGPAVKSQPIDVKVSVDDQDSGDTLDISYTVEKSTDGGSTWTTYTSGTNTGNTPGSTVTVETIPAGDTSVGDQFRVKSTVTDGFNTSAESTSSATEIIDFLVTQDSQSFSPSPARTADDVDNDVTVNTTTAQGETISMIFNLSKNGGLDTTRGTMTQTGSTFTDTILSTETQQTDTFTYDVWAETSHGRVSAIQTYTFTVQNQVPTVNTTSFSPSTLISGQSFDGLVTVDDADSGDTLTVDWALKLNGTVNKTGQATGVTPGSQVNLFTQPSTEVKKDQTYQFDVDISDGFDTTQDSSAIQTVQGIQNFTIAAQDSFTGNAIQSFNATINDIDWGQTQEIINASGSANEQSRTSYSISVDEEGYITRLGFEYNQTGSATVEIQDSSNNVIATDTITVNSTNNWHVHSFEPASYTDSLKQGQTYTIQTDTPWQRRSSGCISFTTDYGPVKSVDDCVLPRYKDSTGGNTMTYALSTNNIGTKQYTTTNGQIVTDITNDNLLVNVTIRADSYITETFQANTSQSLFTASLADNKSRFIASTDLLGNKVTDYNITISGQTFTSNTTFDSPDKYNATFTKQGFTPKTSEFNASLSNSFTDLGDAELNVTVTDLDTSNTVQNFNVTVTDDNTFITTKTTTNGKATISLLKNETYTVTVDSADYPETTKTVTVVNSSQTTNFQLYKERSLFFTFKNADTNQKITQQINVSFISTPKSFTNTTNTGEIKAELLVPATYRVTAKSQGYADQTYTYTVTDEETTNTTYYLYPSTADNITVQVVDETTQPVANAKVTLQQYFQNTNTYQSVGSKKTDQNGKVIMQANIQDDYYRFLVQKDQNTLSPTPTPPSTIKKDTVIIPVSTGTTFGDEWNQYRDIQSTLTYNDATDTVTLQYTTTDGFQEKVCLTLSRTDNYSQNQYKQSCKTSVSETISLTTDTNTTDVLAEAQLQQSNGALITFDSLRIQNTLEDIFGDLGIILQIMITLAAALTAVYSVQAATIITPLTIVVGGLIGLHTIAYAYTVPLLAIGIILSLIQR